MSGAAPVPAPGARTLGFWMATALVVGNIIGAGIFAMPAALAPFGLNALTGWLVTVLGCACLALAFAELARRFPRDDGPYAYTLRAFGPWAAFFVMWCYWVSVWVANAAIAIAVIGYVLYFVPQLAANPLAPPVAALALVWLFVLINLRGARTAGWVQLLTTALKLVPSIAVILLGLGLLITHPHVYIQHVPPNPASWREVASVSSIALFAMLGLECATIPAARVRDPARNIPRATLAGTLIAASLYICISVVPMFLIPQAQLAASSAPFADLFAQRLGGQWGGWIAAFCAISGLGALATRAGVEGAACRVHAPLIRLTKAEIIRAGLALGVDYGMTVSCYQADGAGRACGRCDACRLRGAGFIAAGVADPTAYQDGARGGPSGPG